jgi:hypothetical protein
MKKRIIVICIAMIMGTNAFGEKIFLSTPKGSISIELEGIGGRAVTNEEKKTAEVKVIEKVKRNEEVVVVKNEEKPIKNPNEELYLYNMVRKLKKVDHNYLAKLEDDEDREKSKQLINEIYALIQVLYPENKMLYSMLEEEKENKTEKIVKKPVEPPKPQAMDEQDFSRILSNIEDEAFDKDKLEVINMTLIGKPISLEQCNRVLKVFPFDDGKLKAMEAIYKNVIDKSNGYSLVNNFVFINTKNEAKKIVMNTK